MKKASCWEWNDDDDGERINKSYWQTNGVIERNDLKRNECEER